MVQKGSDGPKRVPNCQKHLVLPFRTLMDPFGPLWNVDKPAMFGHFCLFYWCVFLGHPVYISMSILSMSILMSMLASSNCSEQWVPASLAPCSDLCAGSRHGQQPPGNQRPVAAWPRLWFTAQADSHDKQTSHPASLGKFCAGLSHFWWMIDDSGPKKGS